MPLRRDTSQPTEREREVLKLLCQGYGSAEVGGILGISRRTVEAHRSNMMKRLNVNNFAGLLKYAIREGITELS